jgi:hypothetical protein
MQSGLSWLISVVTFCLVAATSCGAEDTPGTKKIIVTGTGADSEQALKNAFTVAVETSVGTLIDAKSQVDKSDEIQEQIITASNGFIQSYEIIKEWSEGGLHHSRIEAVVQLRQLRQKLETIGVISAEVSGGNLAARVQTERAAENGGAALIAKHLEELPGAILRVKLSGEPVPERGSNDGITRLMIPVTVTVDQSEYANTVEEFEGVLEKLALFRESLPIQLPPVEKQRDQFVYGFANLCSSGVTLMADSCFRAYENYGIGQGTSTLARLQDFERAIEHRLSSLGNISVGSICKRIRATGGTTVTVYALDKYALESVPLQAGVGVELQAKLLDGTGEEIDAAVHVLAFPNAGPYSPFILSRFVDNNHNERPSFRVCPGFRYNGDGAQSLVVSWSGSIPADVKTSELNRLKEIRLKVTWKAHHPNY